MKVLFLDADMGDFSDFFRRHRNISGICESTSIYNHLPLFVRKVLQFIGIKFFSPMLYFTYGNWKKRISEYDCVVLPSRKTCKYALKLLKNKKTIVYYWNLITEKEMLPSEIKQSQVSLCTFDPGDAKKYGIQYADTYYFDLKESSTRIENDLFYVGIIRPHRMEELNHIKDCLRAYNIKFDFNIMQYDHQKERLTYQEILARIQKSRVIVDLTREGQCGLTLRPLEAFQFRKKLITDNRNIVNYEFYNKNNIFILGMDDESKLYEFIQSPYEPLSDEIIEKYYFENWLKRLIAL